MTSTSGSQSGQGGMKATEKYIEFLCDLNDASNKRSTAHSSPRDKLCKLEVALSTWKEERQFHESRKESRKAEIKEAKTEIYQMIGFYSLVQGVLFQGVSSMASAGLCSKVFRFSLTLSLLTSVATIGGVSLKLRDLQQSIRQLSDAQGTVQVLEDLLTQLQSSGDKFDWKNAETAPEFLTASAVLRQQGERSLLIFAIVVLLLLVGFSIVFPFSFHRILCSL